MRGFFFVLAAFLLLISCDRKDYLESLNTPPVLLKQGNISSNVIDSVKLTTSSIYSLPLELTDKDLNVERLEFTVLNGNGFFIDGSGNRINELTNVSDLMTVLYNTNNDITNHVLAISAIDAFNQKSSLNVTVTAFDNLTPVASCIATLIGVNDPREYKLDASSSIDRDENFGGYLQKYKFTINGNPISVTNDFLNYIFPSAGNYDISVQVQDNDGAWSNSFSFILNVQ